MLTKTNSVNYNEKILLYSTSLLQFIHLSALPTIVSHNISIDPEYILPSEKHKIMCNVEVDQANTKGRFLWKIDGFELRGGRRVQNCQYESCVSEPCDCNYIGGVEWYHSGKSKGSSYYLLVKADSLLLHGY